MASDSALGSSREKSRELRRPGQSFSARKQEEERRQGIMKKRNRKDGAISCFRQSSIRRSASPGPRVSLLLSLHHHHDFPVTNTSTFFTPSGQVPLFPNLPFFQSSISTWCRLLRLFNLFFFKNTKPTTTLSLSLELFTNIFCIHTTNTIPQKWFACQLPRLLLVSRQTHMDPDEPVLFLTSHSSRPFCLRPW